MSAVRVTPIPAIPDVKLIETQRFGDARGFFSETYNRRAFAEAGIDTMFVQDSRSLSVARGTLRGLHFQTCPFAQAKLVRVARGRIVDIAVDIRHGSPTFGKHVSVILSAEEGHQILIPVGFAHGFVTLEPNTEVIYKVSDFYSPEHDKGIFWKDSELGIDWHLGESEAVLSERDRRHPRLADLPRYFEFGHEGAGAYSA